MSELNRQRLALELIKQSFRQTSNNKIHFRCTLELTELID